MLAVAFYDVVKWVHITAVLVAFGPLFAYPLWLAFVQRWPLERRAALHHLQIEFSKKITGPVIVLILLAGIYLATDRKLWDEAYVSISFVSLLVIAGLGATVLRRNEERVVEAAEAGDEATYAPALAALRTWTLVTIVLIVLTVYVMTAKPFA